jgi:putative membrane protein (TIGR04086 family)
MIAKGILVSYIATIPLFLVFALVLSYTDFPEKYVSPVVVIVSAISIMIAGSTATRKIKNKGWLNGSVVGFIYVLILYILSSFVYNNFTIDRHVLLMTILGIILGSIGGIIGINLKRGSNYSTRSH